MEARRLTRPRRRAPHEKVAALRRPAFAAKAGAAPVAAGEGELRSFLSGMLPAILALSSANAAAVRMIDAEGGHLELVAAIGLPPEMLRAERSVDSDCGSCGRAFQADSMEVESGLAACSRTTECEFFGKSCTTLVAIPIHGQGRPVGVLSLFFPKGRKVPPATMRLLKPIGQLLDMTLTNATAASEDFRTSLLAERQMMASEVHDSLAQNLAYMRMRMNLLEDAVAKRDESRAAKFCGDINNALGEAHGRLRELITHFRQSMDPRGLLHALQEITVDFSQKTGILLEIESHVTDLRLPADNEVQVFHIIQEALTNVMKHAGAQLVRVVIERTGEGFEIRVEDDGVGPSAGWAPRDGAADGGHYGLCIMRERAERIGGRIEIGGAPGRGSCVRLVFPDPSAQAGLL